MLSTLFRMILSSSVIVGKIPAGLKGPKAGTIPNTGAIPREAVIFTNCSLVTASTPFTIWITHKTAKHNNQKLDTPGWVVKFLNHSSQLTNRAGGNNNFNALINFAY